MMMVHNQTGKKSKQRGQAMTEFVITATYLLVPLFLIVPLLAKYIDIKHAGINAARYQAWEYTSWHDPADDHEIMDNFTSTARPNKTKDITQRETRRRFFSRIQESTPGNPAVQITSADATATWTRAQANPLWTDHRGNYLVGAPLANSLTTAQATPGFTLMGVNIGTLVNGIMSIIDTVSSTFADVLNTGLNALGGVFGVPPAISKFSAINTEGYTSVNFNLPVTTRVDPLDATSASIDSTGTNVVLNFNSQAGVLSEGWNAGGYDHTYEQVAGIVPTTILRQILRQPPMSWAWPVVEFMAPELTTCISDGRFSLAKTLGLIPENGSLWLGYVDSDTVHPDRLSGGGTHVCDAAGRCRLQPNIPMSHVTCLP